HVYREQDAGAGSACAYKAACPVQPLAEPYRQAMAAACRDGQAGGGRGAPRRQAWVRGADQKVWAGLQGLRLVHPVDRSEMAAGLVALDASAVPVEGLDAVAGHQGRCSAEDRDCRPSASADEPEWRAALLKLQPQDVLPKVGFRFP